MFLKISEVLSILRSEKWLYQTTVDMKVTPLKPKWLIKNQFCSKSQVGILVELFNNSLPVLIAVCLVLLN